MDEFVELAGQRSSQVNRSTVLLFANGEAHKGVCYKGTNPDKSEGSLPAHQCHTHKDMVLGLFGPPRLQFAQEHEDVRRWILAALLDVWRLLARICKNWWTQDMISIWLCHGY